VKKHNKGTFITFEGGEGAGKSTVVKLVEKLLVSKNFNVFLTREPGGTGLKFSEEIRRVIMEYDDIDPITELFLFNASRREHMSKKIIPSLNKGEIVISDRFSDSTYIYQCIVKGVDPKIFFQVNKIIVEDNDPSLVFIFDIDPEEGLKRISSKKRTTNRFDQEDINFHKKIREAYLELYKTNKSKYILIDASKSLEDITKEISEKIIDYVNKIK